MGNNLDLNHTLQQAQAAQAAGKPHEALSLYQHLLTAVPDHLEIQIMCGNLCVETGQFALAVSYFRNVYQQMQQQRDARISHGAQALCYAIAALGNLSHTQGDFKTAAACFSEATQLSPENAEYWYNLGNAQRELGNAKNALHSYQSALKLDPNDADTFNNLGNVLRELGRLDEAITAYETALKLNPDMHHTLAHLIHQKQHICDWQGLDAQISTVRHYLQTDSALQISPFAFLSMPGTTAAEQLRCANLWNGRQMPVCEPISMRVPTHRKKHVHIAYLSADFRQHPLAYLITDMLAAHDRNSFTISAYVANRQDASSAESTFKHAVDHWIDITEMNDQQAAIKMADDGIDILVDLTGFTQNSRSMIAAYRPANAHINWLGYPGTMGMYHGTPLFDYMIADEMLINHAEEACYAEKVIRLPCYQPNNRTRPIGKLLDRAEYGLPQDAFVFCCFNQSFKITAEVFAIWMQLLKDIPDSVLWLMDCNRWARDNLRTSAQNAKVDANRLVFAPRTDIAMHLARHAHADLFLDTLPYNAHTTASDALFMGLPVLTCKGSTFPSRVSASLLHHLGLEELITDSLESYSNRALQLASQPDELQDIKLRVAKSVLEKDLFKPEIFARRLEAEYLRIFQG